MTERQFNYPQRKGTSGNTQRVIPRDLNAAERVVLALKLRRQRLTYQEIADQCGYASKGAARNAIKRELQRVVVIEVDEYRRQELEILDEIHQKIWPLVTDPKSVKPQDSPNLWAADRLLALSEARRKLLNLDIHPDSQEVNTNYTKKIILDTGNGEVPA